MNAKPSTHWRKVALCAVGLVAVPWGSVRGEAFPLADVIPDSVPAEVRKSIQGKAQQNADAMYGHLLLLIDEADRETNLSAAQKSRLTVAAKGAVQYVMDQWLAPLSTPVEAAANQPQAAGNAIVFLNAQKPFIVQRGRVANQAVQQQQLLAHRRRIAVLEAQIRQWEARIKADANKKNAARNAAQLRRVQLQLENAHRASLNLQGLAQLGAMGELDSDTAANHNIWRSTLEYTLTDRQQNQLTLLQQARRDDPTATRVEYIVAALDRQLLFDSGQRQRVTRMVAEFLETPRIGIMLARNPNLKNDAVANTVIKTFRTNEFDQILSPIQLSQWRKLTKTSTAVGFFR